MGIGRPLPTFEAVAKDKSMRYFGGLIVFVWLKECPCEESVDQTEDEEKDE